MKRQVTLVLVAMMVVAMVANVAPAPHTVLAAAGSLASPYNQNFDTLANSGTPSWSDDSTISGWYSNRTSYLVGAGTVNNGALYSFGTSGATDRALGSIASGSTNTIYYGVRFVNDTGGVVTQLAISYNGEQWRTGGSSTTTPSVAQKIDFQYQIGANSLTAGSWIDFNLLDFTSPIYNTIAASSLDGNLVANRTALSANITGLTILPNQEVWLRWMDINDANNDHGLAVDDLSVTATSVPMDAAPNVASTTPANGSSSILLTSNLDVTFSEAVNVSGNWFQLSCPTSGDRTPTNSTATVTGGPSTFTINPIFDFANSETCTLTIDPLLVSDQDTNDPPDTMAATFTMSFTVIGPDNAPEVASTVPANGASNVPLNQNITVNFTEPVNVVDPWFTLTCATSGAHAASVSGGPTSWTLNPSVDFVYGELCTLTIDASKITDQDNNDPPDNMVFNFVAGFTTVPDPCTLPYTTIPAIQGSGLSAAIIGNVTTQGVVVGDFEGSAAASGFYIQDLSGDGDPDTSDGIFVYTGSNNFVSLGQVVRVTGFARERFTQTTLNGSDNDSSAVPSANIVQCSTGSVNPVDVTLPVANLNDFESYEGMYVRFPQPLVIAEYFNYDRFGEIVLAQPLPGETRPFTGTAIDEPGVDANARTAANALSRITLDDVQSAQNPSVLRHPNGQPFSLTNLFRGGDTVANTVGVLGYDFGLYRIVPTGPADYTAANPRQATPEAVGGTLRVAAMNTLNFFVTADYPSGALDNKCGPLNNVECRGWDSNQPLEFTRQRDKLLAALSGLDADVIGLNELENSTGVEPLISITSGMPGYDYIATGTIGTDAIKVGMIYRPAVVTPVGGFQLLTSAVDPRFIDTKSRPSLAQTFEVNATGARFTVVVNHFKSKGSDCNDIGDPDLGDGQGNCSQTRRAAAEALVDWLATDPTGSGDPDYIIMGDLNSYAMEDTINEIKDGADDTASTGDDYTNLISHFQGTFAYSYTFDGQAGYLDHALANASLFAQVTGAADWHINSDEPDVLDYDTSFKPAAQDALYEVNAFRTSDHDPVVIGLVPNAPPTVDAGGPYEVIEGQQITLTATGSDPNGDTLTYSWDLDNNGSFETNGQSVIYTAPFVVGPHYVHVKATDPLGLFGVYSVTINVIYNWSGFFQPIDNPPFVNLAKAGSSIPVKFGLGGDKGLNIFAAGFPISQPIACDTGAPQDAIEQTVTAGLSTLTYDPLTGQYIYVWKTVKGWAGTCRLLTVTLVDGTTHTAKFSFR